MYLLIRKLECYFRLRGQEEFGLILGNSFTFNFTTVYEFHNIFQISDVRLPHFIPPGSAPVDRR